MWTTFVISFLVWLVSGPGIARQSFKRLATVEVMKLAGRRIEVTKEYMVLHYIAVTVAVVSGLTWVGIGLFKIIQGINS